VNDTYIKLDELYATTT